MNIQTSYYYYYYYYYYWPQKINLHYITHRLSYRKGRKKKGKKKDTVQITQCKVADPV